MSSERIERRARALSGLPRPVDPTLKWWQHLLRNRWTWITLALLVSYGLAMWVMYRDMSHNIRTEIEAVTSQMGSPAIVTQSQLDEAFLTAAQFAAYTLSAYVLIFILVDRLRPTTWTMKLLALGWGATIATLVSLYVNTWVSGLIRIEGPVDNTTAARSAIFVAPFVEEAAKATILFLLAMAVRYRLVTVFQTLTLAGLSAVGFAFTENIIYYSRTFMYSAKIYGNDPDAALRELVLLRGLATSWGHPLFTTATAIGLIVALRARAKFVRIVAPLAGFAFAVLGHMAFNGLASLGAQPSSMVFSGGLLLFSLIMWLIRKLRAERQLIATRLEDFVQMGWLQPADPIIFTRHRTRLKLLVAGLLRGRKVFRDTLGLQRSITELAYLRSMMTHGVVDGSGDERMVELINAIRLQRIFGLDNPEGLKLKPDTWRMPRFKILNRFRRTPALPPPQAQPVPALAGAPVAGRVPPPPAPPIR